MSESCVCPGCEGRGNVRDFKDNDPVEGYKLAPYYKCVMCDGQKKIIDKDERYTACLAYWRVYNKKTEKTKATLLQQENIKKKLIKSAKSKLTKEELKALGVRDE